MGKPKAPMAGPLSSYISSIISERDCSVRSVSMAAGVENSHLSRLARTPDMAAPNPRYLDKIADALKLPCTPFLVKGGWLGPRKDIPNEKSFSSILLNDSIPPETRKSYLKFHFARKGIDENSDTIISVEEALSQVIALNIDPDEYFWMTGKLPSRFSKTQYTPYLASKINKYQARLERASILTVSPEECWKVYYSKPLDPKTYLISQIKNSSKLTIDCEGDKANIHITTDTRQVPNILSLLGFI